MRLAWPMDRNAVFVVVVIMVNYESKKIPVKPIYFRHPKNCRTARYNFTNYSVVGKRKRSYRACQACYERIVHKIQNPYTAPIDL